MPETPASSRQHSSWSPNTATNRSCRASGGQAKRCASIKSARKFSSREFMPPIRQ